MTPVEIFERLGFSPLFQGIAGVAWMGVVLFIMVRAEQAKRHMQSAAAPVAAVAAAVTPPNGSIARIADLQLQIGNEMIELRQVMQKVEMQIAELATTMSKAK